VAVCRNTLTRAGFAVLRTVAPAPAGFHLTDGAVYVTETAHVTIHGPRRYSVVRTVLSPDGRTLLAFSPIKASIADVVRYLVGAGVPFATKGR
jgi:hypothetical protein